MDTIIREHEKELQEKIEEEKPKHRNTIEKKRKKKKDKNKISKFKYTECKKYIIFIYIVILK